MKDLKVRKETNTEEAYQSSLDNLRAQINVADNQLIELLGKRMKISGQIGALKKRKTLLYYSLNVGTKFLEI